MNLAISRKNKGGQVTLFIIFVIFAAFLIAVFLGISVFAISYISNALSIDQDIGAVNLNESVQNSIGKISNAFLSNADLIGLLTIFGMVLGLMCSAFFLRGNFPRVFIIADILIIVLFVIISVYISNTYADMIERLADIIPQYTESIPHTSNLVLNLHNTVMVIGAIIILLTHIVIPRKRRNEETLSFDY